LIGHDNLVVWVPQDKTRFSGDLLFVGCHPFIGESDVQGWMSDLDAVAAFNAEKVISGHGRLATANDIAEMKVYLKAFDENAAKLAKGRRQDDAPSIAKELEKLLPSQGRDLLPYMLEYNLRTKYLP
jgi:glyoxylase-like metal-dependent hydrolase (beta-lactamase superfamily II)